ncbi:MAG: glycosyltransferase family 4 protein [Candidatus Aminicenantes bacterium]|nr:MAG: glycosyltransferase family 4 protein [Candidatus Aminicenantes bacterium]
MSDKIKVLHIITRLDKGGSAENTFLTVKGLDKKKYDVTLMSGPVQDPSQERRIQIEECGIPYIHMPVLVRNINVIADAIAFFKIRRFLAKKKFDVVHTHTSKAGLLGRFAARLAGVPVVVHTPHGHVFFGYFGLMKTKIFILLEKLANRMTDRIVALTHREKADYISYRTCPEEKLTVIPSGIELNKFREYTPSNKTKLKKEIGLPENSFVVGTAGRLVPVKGPEFLINASQTIIPKHPNTCFLFAGDGPLKEDLQKKANEAGGEKNIFFLGWRDDIEHILSIFDVFCLPSLNEGMGRVLVEAMAHGIPIVASDVGGIPDLVTHGKNGFLVPPKNPEELAKHIQILIEDEAKRKKMGEAGKKMAQKFSHESMVKNIAALYEELLT